MMNYSSRPPEEPAVHAQDRNTAPVSREELRELLIHIAARLDAAPNKSDAAIRLQQKIDALDNESFEYLYKFSSNWQKLRIAAELMSTTPAARKATAPDIDILQVSPAGLPADLFATAYPTGSNYSTFRATLPGHPPVTIRYGETGTIGDWGITIVRAYLSVGCSGPPCYVEPFGDLTITMVAGSPPANPSDGGTDVDAAEADGAGSDD